MAVLALPASHAAAHAADAESTVPGGRPPTSAVRPFQAEGEFTDLLDATFGRTQPGAMVYSKAELDRIAYCRFISGDHDWRRHGRVVQRLP